jgi:hypothetical protein
VGDECRIAWIGDQSGEALRNAQVPLDSGEQQNAAI